MLSGANPITAISASKLPDADLITMDFSDDRFVQGASKQLEQAPASRRPERGTLALAQTIRAGAVRLNHSASIPPPADVTRLKHGAMTDGPGLRIISTVMASESVTVPVTASESVTVPVTASESVTVPVSASESVTVPVTASESVTVPVSR